MSPIAVIAVSLAPEAFSSIPAKETLPNVAKAIMMAIDRPKSPTRFMTNAFFAAVAYSGFWFQKPINRYEARPTPSQPT